MIEAWRKFGKPPDLGYNREVVHLSSKLRKEKSSWLE